MARDENRLAWSGGVHSIHGQATQNNLANKAVLRWRPLANRRGNPYRDSGFLSRGTNRSIAVL
jgi:hypothetical protein